MVESLKRSVERLQPPSCVHCRIQMIWYRTVRAAERDEIVHYFQCTSCNRLQEVTSKMRSDQNGKGGPPKSAGPARAKAAQPSPCSHFQPRQIGAGRANAPAT